MIPAKGSLLPTSSHGALDFAVGSSSASLDNEFDDYDAGELPIIIRRFEVWGGSENSLKFSIAHSI